LGPHLLSDRYLTEKTLVRWYSVSTQILNCQRVQDIVIIGIQGLWYVLGMFMTNWSCDRLPRQNAEKMIRLLDKVERLDVCQLPMVA
jgi:hypothetical protein